MHECRSRSVPCLVLQRSLACADSGWMALQIPYDSNPRRSTSLQTRTTIDSSLGSLEGRSQSASRNAKHIRRSILMLDDWMEKLANFTSGEPGMDNRDTEDNVKVEKDSERTTMEDGDQKRQPSSLSNDLKSRSEEVAVGMMDAPEDDFPTLPETRPCLPRWQRRDSSKRSISEPRTQPYKSAVEQDSSPMLHPTSARALTPPKTARPTQKAPHSRSASTRSTWAELAPPERKSSLLFTHRLSPSPLRSKGLHARKASTPSPIYRPLLLPTVSRAHKPSHDIKHLHLEDSSSHEVALQFVNGKWRMS